MKKNVINIMSFVIVLLVGIIIFQRIIYTSHDLDKIWFTVRSDSLGIKGTSDYSFEAEYEEDCNKLTDRSGGYTFSGNYGEYECKIGIDGELIKKSVPEYQGNGIKFTCKWFNTNAWHRIFIETNVEVVNDNGKKCEITVDYYYIAEEGHLTHGEEEKIVYDLEKQQFLEKQDKESYELEDNKFYFWI